MKAGHLGKPVGNDNLLQLAGALEFLLQLGLAASRLEHEAVDRVDDRTEKQCHRDGVSGEDGAVDRKQRGGNPAAQRPVREPASLGDPHVNHRDHAGQEGTGGYHPARQIQPFATGPQNQRVELYGGEDCGQDGVGSHTTTGSTGVAPTN
jgi:hypothetical protein